MAAGLGGNPAMRPDQELNLARSRAGSGPAPSNVGLFRIVIVRGPGGGVFVYDTLGNLVDSMAFSSNVDPLTHSNRPGIVSYLGTIIAQLFQGQLNLGLTTDSALAQLAAASGQLSLTSGKKTGGGTTAALFLNSSDSSTGLYGLLFAGSAPAQALLLPSGDTTGAVDLAAITSLLGSGYAVRLMPGTFYINSGLVPASNAVLIGCGAATIIRWDQTVVPTAISASALVKNVILRDFRLAQSNAAAGGTAIDFTNFQFSQVKNVVINGLTKNPNIGISFTGTVGNHYNVVEDCQISVDGASAVGIQFTGGGSGAISNVVRNCRIIPSTTDATQTGIIVASRSIELDHVDIEHAAGIGIDVQTGGDACTIISPYLESNGTNLQFASGVIGPFVVGGTILTGTTADITNNGALGYSIIGVRFTGGVPYNESVLQQSAAAGRILRVINTHTAPSDATVRVDAKTAGDPAIGVRVTGDGNNRWRVNSDGALLWSDGTNPADVTLQRSAANILQVATASLDISTTGSGLQVAEGSNAKQGIATLSGISGTVTVANTSVTASSRIFLTAQDSNTVGALRVSARTPGTSFMISSSNNTDSGVVAYEIFEPG